MNKLLVLIVLVAAVAVALFVFMRPTQAAGVLPTVIPSPIPTSASPSGSPAPTSVSTSPSGSPTVDAAKLERDWASIDNERVQRACLAMAKQQAVAQGYSDSLVFACTCSPSESPGVKSYDCKIAALDGNHPASAACTKSTQSCEVTSQFGTQYYTFDQLRDLAS